MHVFEPSIIGTCMTNLKSLHFDLVPLTLAERVSESRARKQKTRLILFNARFEIDRLTVDYLINGFRIESLGKITCRYRSGCYMR
jgi:hypothetical protein